MEAACSTSSTGTPTPRANEARLRYCKARGLWQNKRSAPRSQRYRLVDTGLAAAQGFALAEQRSRRGRLLPFPSSASITTPMEHEHQPSTKGQEVRAFLFLTAVLAPVLAVIIVFGYGFFVWMYQLLTGDLPGAM